VAGDTAASVLVLDRPDGRRGARAGSPPPIGWALLWIVAVFYLYLAWFGWRRELGFDSHAYWAAWQHSSMYGVQANHQDAFLYSPLFAQLLWPLTLLPWPVFLTAWTLAGLVAYAWLLWPLGLRWAVPLFLFCIPQAVVGNVWPFFALVVVFGYRRPGLWAFPLLTKVTSGMGVVWFAVRREWRPLVRVAAFTVVLVAVSVAVSPGLWAGWLHLLAGGGSSDAPAAGAYDVPLLYRLPAALALAAYGARKGRPGLLAAAVGLGSPVFALSWLFSNAFVLTALPRLRRTETA
jgi:Glycosyltransferase family 87